MSNITLSQIITYPLKSAAGNYAETGDVTSRGLKNDRHWVLLDSENQAITARAFPKLLQIQPEVKKSGLSITHNISGEKIHFETPIDQSSLSQLNIFSEQATGLAIGNTANEWFSNYLGVACRLAFMSPESHRDFALSRGGKEGDVVSYADEAPFLLLSEASVADLNSRLDSPVTLKHFRPNLVIKGCDAYAEDQWKMIRIGECEFEVAQLCKRCVFTTINPETQEKSPKGEPLRTLASYKKHPKGGVAFGVHLVARKLGVINKGDLIEILT